MYQNAQFKNSGNDEGDVLNYFNNHLRNLVQKNSGDNTFSIVQEECHDKDVPVRLKTKTKLRLTHSAHTISQIEKGFINLTLNMTLNFTTPYGGGDIKGKESSHLNYIFVGFKDAVEIIGEAYFWVDGKLVDSYHQQEMVRESFAYNCIRPRDAKTGVPHSHSLWENVQMMSPNVCGCYIPLEAFDNGAHPAIKMELIIPFTDQLALQAWRLYPNRILGQVEEEVKFVLDGLVWCQIQPQNVAEVKKFWDFDPKKEYSAPLLPITNHFTQIGNSAIVVASVANAEAITTKQANTDEFGDGLYTALSSVPVKTEELKYCIANGNPAQGQFNYGLQKYVSYKLMSNKLEFDENSVKIDPCHTNCAGFGIKEEVNNALFQLLNEPIIIPSQELTRYQFENTASSSGFTSLSKSVPLRNATNITMMFPSHPNDFTVFKNIMYDGVRLVVNKKAYPETDFENTYDARFVQYQLMANELDGCIEPTREFMESISRPLIMVDEKDFVPSAGDPAKHQRFLMCPFDNTSFGINFQLERGNAGYVFDGLDSGSHSVTIEFRGKPLARDKNDPYLYPDLKIQLKDNNPAKPMNIVELDPTINPQAPEMWICSDTYWTWSIQDGVKYYNRGVPAGYD